MGPRVLGEPVAWPIADAPEVPRFVNDFAADVKSGSRLERRL
jgi:hypothetical protein